MVRDALRDMSGHDECNITFKLSPKVQGDESLYVIFTATNLTTTVPHYADKGVCRGQTWGWLVI